MFLCQFSYGNMLLIIASYPRFYDTQKGPSGAWWNLSVYKTVEAGCFVFALKVYRTSVLQISIPPTSTYPCASGSLRCFSPSIPASLWGSLQSSMTFLHGLSCYLQGIPAGRAFPADELQRRRCFKTSGLHIKVFYNVFFLFTLCYLENYIIILNVFCHFVSLYPWHYVNQICHGCVRSVCGIPENKTEQKDPPDRRSAALLPKSDCTDVSPFLSKAQVYACGFA